MKDLDERDIWVTFNLEDRKWNIREILIALSELSRIASNLKLCPIVKETASCLYKKMMIKKKMNWQEQIEFAGASIYAASRLFYLPQTLDEIAEQANIEWENISRAYKLMLLELPELKSLPKINPSSFVYRFCNELGVSDDTEEEALHMLSEITKKCISIGGKPQGKAAGAIYLACKLNSENKTQKEIAAIAKVSDNTVRNRYRDIARELDITL